ncbi:DUF948 domain-containing protein [Caldalkalibacillus salinus]|uniref:DUF948 domain-containing protein n=1 Tax=Caldalkalibacillus salinus TaxID=2803787 RepID=UPI001924B91D|nr:DUF948 domain-containing protein [Caldalkalibacillus salinus]
MDNMIEISVAVIAGAFILLVIYVIATLRSVRRSLHHLDKSIIHMQQQVDQVSKETTELMKNSNRLAVDLQRKSKTMDTLFHSLGDASQVIQQMTTSLKQVSSSLTNNVQKTVDGTNKHQDRINDVVKYSSLALKFWQAWQARRESEQHRKDITSQTERESIKRRS